MRFLSLALLSGCALVDANKESKVPGDVPSALEFDVGTIAESAGASEVSIGELDQPADALDVIFLAFSPGRFSTARNMGAGQFFEAQLSASLDYTRLVTRDIDNDGVVELIGAGPNKLDVYRADGVGGFELTANLSNLTLQTPDHLTTGSFPALEQGSNVAAVVISYSDMNKARVISNVFGTATMTEINLFNRPEDLIVANVAGAGGDEIVIAYPGTAAIQMVSNVGPSPTIFDQPITNDAFVLIMAGGELGGSTVETDVAYVERQNNNIGVLRVGLGSAQGLTVDSPQLASGLDALDLAVADFDGDALDDVVVLVRTNTGRQLRVFFTNQLAPASITVDAMAEHIVVGNLNGDGKADVLVYPAESGIDVLLSR